MHTSWSSWVSANWLASWSTALAASRTPMAAGGAPSASRSMAAGAAAWSAPAGSSLSQDPTEAVPPLDDN